MKKRTRYDDDMPSKYARVIPDYLPPPEELLPPGSKMKITIELDEDCVDFFQKQAAKHGGHYQRMIREVLRRYAQHHSRKKAA
jgi:uncharacterized protein (DUF4415 family)